MWGHPDILLQIFQYNDKNKIEQRKRLCKMEHPAHTGTETARIKV